MTNDIFYSILKLVSGEEILAKVCAFIENDEVMIVLDNPIIVNMGLSSKNRTPFVKVTPWLSLSSDTTHIIRRKDVMTMTEVKDKSIVAIHKQYVGEVFGVDYSNKSNSRPKNIIKVDEAREMFEKLYHSKESHSKTD